MLNLVFQGHRTANLNSPPTRQIKDVELPTVDQRTYRGRLPASAERGALRVRQSLISVIVPAAVAE
jgi:hypothetical protein